MTPTRTAPATAAPDLPARNTDQPGRLLVYTRDTAPKQLRTATQLQTDRRKVADGQQPRAYLRIRPRGRYIDVPLYDPQEAAPMRPLSARQQAQKLERRTCIACATIADSPLYERSRPWSRPPGRICDACDAAAQERYRRTCPDCRTEFQQRESIGHFDPRGYFSGVCQACHDRTTRGRAVAHALTLRHCPDCQAQTAAREEVEEAQRSDSYGFAFGYPRTCEPCQTEQKRQAEEARQRAERERWDELGPVRTWARHVVSHPDQYAVLDTETTGLEWDAKIVEISITDGAGRTLLDTLVHPGVPIPDEAAAIHGITDADVQHADPFPAVLPRITDALRGRRIIIYNRAYDTGVLAYELDRHHRVTAPPLPGLTQPEDEPHPATAQWMDAQHWDRCAMLAYAVQLGDWSDYWQGWSWPRLNGGHRALGDCRAVVTRIQEIAACRDPA